MPISTTSFKAWYDQYFPMLYLFVKGYMLKKQIPFREKEVEDLVQNTFLALWERKSDQPITYPIAYLKKVAIREVVAYVEEKKRINQRAISDQLLEKIPQQNSPSRMEKAEEEQQVWGLLGTILNQLECKIVFKRVVQGYSYKEIAQQENIANEKHLHVLYHRAKLKLYQYLKNHK